MTQIDRKLVETKARQVFPHEDASQVMLILNAYGVEPWEISARNRVHLACLKLSGGDLILLRRAVAVAKSDFRDVFMMAEYPNLLEAEREAGGLAWEGMSEQEQRRVEETDLGQYRTWLNGGDSDS